jgi:hypothetical protein
MHQYDIILKVTYFAPRYKSEHTYRFENIQFPNMIEPGDEISLPKEIRAIGFDNLFEVSRVSHQNDQVDLLIEVSTKSPKPLMHSKLEELCVDHEAYEVKK